MEFIFWFSLAFIFYAYFGYPMVLRILSLFFERPIIKSDITPSLALVISAYNEEKILAEKLKNSLEIDYPQGRLQIAVISDGSTDKTNEIIQFFARNHQTIRACISEENKGKTACLNEFVPQLDGELIVFSDANSFYDKTLLRRIVRPFADPRIGFVTGSTRYVASPSTKAPNTTSLYSKLERWTKVWETKTGSCVGADGAVFAIRKSLFSQMHPDDINDLVIPFHIVGKGFRGILEPSVVCTEQGLEASGEFKRQVRITSRTLRAIFAHKYLLNSFYYPEFSFKIFSHKLAKLLSPLFLTILFVTNVFLSFKGIYVYLAIFGIWIFSFCAFILTYFIKYDSKYLRHFQILRTFILVNLAYAVGWYSFFRGKKYTVWNPHRNK